MKLGGLVLRQRIFYFRRRLGGQFGGGEAITISLRTSDRRTAQFRAARLNARWETMMWSERQRGLSPDIAREFFRRGMNDEIRTLVAEMTDPLPPTPERFDRSCRLHEAAFLLCAGHPSNTSVFPDAAWERLPLLDAADREVVTRLVKYRVDDPTLTDEAMQQFGAELMKLDQKWTYVTERDARAQLLRGKAAAFTRMRRLYERDIPPWVDVLEIALDEERFNAALRDFPLREPRSPQLNTPSSEPSPTAWVSAPEKTPTPNEGPEPSFSVRTSVFAVQDTRRFSEIIEAVEADRIATGHWAPDRGERRRVMRSFAWVTGDLRLCDYRPDDVETWIRIVRQAPVGFDWTGAMSKPFDQALFEGRGKTRSPRTINKEITVMAAVARELQKTAWKTAFGAPFINFKEHRHSVRGLNDEIARLPWQKKHFDALFSLPIYTGNQGSRRRLKPGSKIFHDCVYWVPLIIAYHGFAREEACGFELEDIFLDGPVPYFAMRANRARGGGAEEKRGKKNSSASRDQKFF